MKPIRIAILGAGFGGVYTFQYLHRQFHNNPNIQLILINRTNYFTFSPLLHEVATGSLAPHQVVEPIRKVLGCCLHDFYLANVTKINVHGKIVETTLGSIHYDYCVIALGSATNYYGVKGARQLAFPLKSLADAIRLKNHFIVTFEQASKVTDPQLIKSLLTFVIVGGGPTGVELAAEMSDFFYKTFSNYYSPTLINKVKIILIQKSADLLPSYPKLLRRQALEVLNNKRVEVRLSALVTEVSNYFVQMSIGETIPCQTTIWVAGVRPQPVQFNSRIEKDKIGRLLVNQSLQLLGRRELFALGDIALVINRKINRPLPVTAQVATKQARLVAENIARSIANQPLRLFHYRHAGDLISLGRWQAIADLGKIYLGGHFAWWLWRTVYLTKLISWSKKLKVVLDWTLQLFLPRDISQL